MQSHSAQTLHHVVTASTDEDAQPVALMYTHSHHMHEPSTDRPLIDPRPCWPSNWMSTCYASDSVCPPLSPQFLILSKSSSTCLQSLESGSVVNANTCEWHYMRTSCCHAEVLRNNTTSGLNTAMAQANSLLAWYKTQMRYGLAHQPFWLMFAMPSLHLDTCVYSRAKTLIICTMHVGLAQANKDTEDRHRKVWMPKYWRRCALLHVLINFLCGISYGGN